MSLIKMAKNYFRIDEGDITSDISDIDKGTVDSINNEEPVKLRKSLEYIKQYVEKRPYPGDLPSDLEDYFYYINDNETGYCIACIPEKFYDLSKQTGFDDYECIVPVRYIMENGYRKESGYLIVDVPYDDELGIDIDNGYYEL